MNSCTLALKIDRDTEVYYFWFPLWGDWSHFRWSLFVHIKTNVELWLRGKAYSFAFMSNFTNLWHFDIWLFCGEAGLHDSWTIIRPICCRHSMWHLLNHQCLAPCLHSPAKQWALASCFKWWLVRTPTRLEGAKIRHHSELNQQLAEVTKLREVSASIVTAQRADF